MIDQIREQVKSSCQSELNAILEKFELRLQSYTLKPRPEAHMDMILS